MLETFKTDATYDIIINRKINKKRFKLKLSNYKKIVCKIKHMDR